MKKIITEAGKIDIAAIKSAILALESPKAKRNRERAAAFGELYPVMREQLDVGVSKSAIVKILSDLGLSITVKVFDELIEAEATRRDEPVPGKVADTDEEAN
jgi:hypothetical protein